MQTHSIPHDQSLHRRTSYTNQTEMSNTSRPAPVVRIPEDIKRAIVREKEEETIKGDT